MDDIAADRVLVNGRIVTLDPARPHAAALAIAGDRIVAVGGDREVRRLRDRRTTVVDLRGATVVPGLVDAHAHLDREGLKYLYPSLARCRSIADIQAVIRRLAKARPRGEWIVTMPVGTPPFYMDAPGGLREQRWPTRADLDTAAPDHPAYVRGIWGYWNKPPVVSIANSAALARAGVTGDTVPPKGVEILKDAAGEPTGVFVEHNLVQVLEFTLMRTAPRFTHADRLTALADSQRRYAARGVTAFYEGHGVAPELLSVYREAHERGLLRLRAFLTVSPTWDAADAGRAIPEVAAWAGGRGLGDDRLRVAGICLHYGGDPDVARILHAAQPYTGWAGFVESANSLEAYREQAELAARHRLNPISYLWRSAAEEARKLGGGAETLLPHRSLERLRLPFGLATDNKPADPWLAFRAVVDRSDMASGEVLGPRERLTRLAALRALTVGGAFITFADRERGVLSPGRQADLAVLDQDPLTMPLAEIGSLACRLTMVGGRVVHGDQ